MKKIIFILIAWLALGNASIAQPITYATAGTDDVRRMNFEIIGKLANNYLIYQEAKGQHRIQVYDEGMRLLEEVPITILPRQQLLDVSFYSNGRQVWLLYQYQQGDIVHYKAAKVEANGRLLEAPLLLDTTSISYQAQKKIYNTLISDDGRKMMIYKINRKERTLYRFTTLLYDAQLALLHTDNELLPMDNDGDRIGGYSLTNDGTLAFIKYNRLANGTIIKAELVEKKPSTNTFKTYPIATSIGLDHLFLDDIKVKVDEAQGRYLLASLYSTQKKGNIDGLYVGAIHTTDGRIAFEKTTLFDEELRKKVNGKKADKRALNDHFINSIVLHTAGGFSIATEGLYTDAANQWDRWGYWGGNYWGMGMGWGMPWGGWGWRGMWSPYFYYSPFAYRGYWWGGAWGMGYGWGSGMYGGSASRYYAGSVVVFSFDGNGNKIADNVIAKNQSDRDTDASLSYLLLQRGADMLFYLNNAGKISALEQVAVRMDGTMSAGSSITAKDKHTYFMPRYGRQTGSDEMIIPYRYKNNISFAKITW